MKKAKTKYPRKAKLITEGGFYKIIDLYEFVPRITVPQMKKFRVLTPELGEHDFGINFEMIFRLERKTKQYAIYHQENVIMRRD